jgi:hypothetical protein
MDPYLSNFEEENKYTNENRIRILKDRIDTDLIDMKIH